MLLVFVIVLLILHRNRWYGYGPYWAYPQYRGYGPYYPAYSGYVWNGYAWQPQCMPYYGYPYNYYRRPYRW